MKFTLSWLKQHLETDASVEALSTCMTAIGLEVESIKDPAEKLAPFVIAHVVEAVQLQSPGTSAAGVLQGSEEGGS